MRLFTTYSGYDFENQQWNEIYTINGEITDCDTYFEEMEYEVDGDESEDEDEDESLTITEIIDGYAELLEVPHCPECTKRILEMFYDEITELLDD